MRFFSFSLSSLLGITFVLFTGVGCGSSSNDANPLRGQTLAEVAAPLPRPNVELATFSGNQSNDSSATNNTGTNSTQNNGTSNNSSPSVQTDSSIVLTLRRFLWKPDSERDGNVVVLIDRQNVRVEVFGAISETLTDFGPSNDRGTTARGSFPGCDYGSGIQLQFYDASSGRRLAYVNGETSITIADGCQRQEFDL